MEIRILIEPGYQPDSILNRTMRSIRSAAQRKKYPVRLMGNATEFGQERVVLVIGASAAWMSRAVEELACFQVHPILMGFQFIDTIYPFSCVTGNHKAGGYRMTKRLLAEGGGKIAFLGLNPDSLQDLLVYNGFHAAASSRGEVFYNYGNITACVESFLARAREFTSILCANGNIAILLLSRLSNAERFAVGGIGNLRAASYTARPLTLFSIDYEEAGRCAVDLCGYLSGHKEVECSTIMVRSTITRNKTLLEVLPEEELLPVQKGKKVDFYGDPVVVEIERLERMLSNCDETDLSLLRQCQGGATYEAMAEKEDLSVSSVKYRLKKLFQYAGLLSRDEMKKQLEQYKLKI